MPPHRCIHQIIKQARVWFSELHKLLASIIFVNVQNCTQEKLTKYHYKILTLVGSYLQEPFYTTLNVP